MIKFVNIRETTPSSSSQGTMVVRKNIHAHRFQGFKLISKTAVTIESQFVISVLKTVLDCGLSL